MYNFDVIKIIIYQSNVLWEILKMKKMFMSLIVK